MANEYAQYYMEVQPIIHDNFNTPHYLGKIRYRIDGEMLAGDLEPLIVPMSAFTPGGAMFQGNRGTRIGVSFEVRFVDANAPQPEQMSEVPSAAGS